jgi:UDP-N-acetylmuramoyl-tripeptide--D-alanyl-D-alanine ligase
MLELGMYEIEGHELVGARAAQVADLLIAVGERAKIIASAALQAGFPNQALLVLADVPQVIEYLRENLEKGDVVLIKGSHGMHMERIVAALEARS